MIILFDIYVLYSSHNISMKLGLIHILLITSLRLEKLNHIHRAKHWSPSTLGIISTILPHTMSSIQFKKLQDTPKNARKTHCQELKQLRKPDNRDNSDVGISERNFNITVINRLHSSGKMGLYTWTGEFQQKDENYKMESNANTKIKNTTSEMENFLAGLISRLDKTEERINKLENRSIKIIQTKTLRKKSEGKQTPEWIIRLWSNIYEA